MSMNVSEFVWQRLSEWGLKRVYGYPGDGVGGLDVALGKGQGHMQYVQVRHEEMAAFMASAHAKFTGEVGSLLRHVRAGRDPSSERSLRRQDGPRARRRAWLASKRAPRSARHYQQEVDLQNLFKDVAGEFVGMASVPEQVRHLIDRAVRIAHTKRTVTCVILPNDLQDSALRGSAARPRHHPYRRRLCRPGQVAGRDAAARRPPTCSMSGKKVAMLVGAGALGATDEVIAVAERLQAGVAKALLGKAALPDDLPCVTGSIGLLGTKPSWDLMKGCDTLLMVGSGFPYSEFLPKPGAARGVQIDIDGSRLSLRYPMEVNMVGDSATTLRALLPLLQQKTDTAWRARSRRGRRPGGRRWKSARWIRPTRSIRSACSGNCRRGCRTTASSPAIPVRSPIGMRAI